MQRCLWSFLALGALLVGCSGSDDFPKTSAKSTDAGIPATKVDDDASAPAKDAGAPTNPDPPTSEDFAGEATYYDADGTGSCGFGKSADFLVAALNKVRYTKSQCGKCARVTGPKGSVTIAIVDLCPGCGQGDLDLSETAFGKVADLADGRVKITWHFTACP